MVMSGGVWLLALVSMVIVLRWVVLMKLLLIAARHAADELSSAALATVVIMAVRAVDASSCC